MNTREQLYELVTQLTPERVAICLKHWSFIARGMTLEGEDYEFFLKALQVIIKKELEK